MWVISEVLHTECFLFKMNSFHKIHLQAFNVISILLYHSGPTFGQVLYSCLDAFVVDASDYSDHLIRHLLNLLHPLGYTGPVTGLLYLFPCHHHHVPEGLGVFPVP
jgi:hypothetical protein